MSQKLGNIDTRLIRDGRRTWPAQDGKRTGDVVTHKSINAAKRHVRAEDFGPYEVWTVEALKRHGLAVPA